MSDPVNEEYCTVCGKPRSNHPFRHAFATTSTGNTLKAIAAEQAEPEASEQRTQVVESAIGGDPVLRLALIRRGIITPDDLAYVEQELKGAGIAFAEQGMAQPRDR